MSPLFSARRHKGAEAQSRNHSALLLLCVSVPLCLCEKNMRDAFKHGLNVE